MKTIKGILPFVYFDDGIMHSVAKGEAITINDTLATAFISSGIAVSGTIEINENGIVNVGDYENAVVNVPSSTMIAFGFVQYQDKFVALAESGMTFSEFANSTYNNVGAEVYNNGITVHIGSATYELYDGDNPVTPTTVVDSGKFYKGV